MARFGNLDDWLDWQSGLSPKAIDLGLERVDAVWRRLGAPPVADAVLTVAGTNGKGSSVAFASAILRAAGYRIGSYTSPHLVRYNERVCIDGEPVDDAGLCRAFAQVDAARGDIALTYFEFGTLAALSLFADAGLDAAVLEVGLGGRLDAVNVVDADVALITAIGLDHQAWLGDDREAIGAEKAGILRAGRPAVFSGHAMPASIRAYAERLGAPLAVAGVDYRVERAAGQWDLVGEGMNRRALPLPGLRGRVQVDNAAGVLVALAQLHDRLPVDQAAIRRGLLEARVAGRFEVRPGAPTLVLDVAHNPQAAAELAATLADLFVAGRRVALCGMLADKDVAAVGHALAARFDAWYCVDLSAESRGLAADTLAERLRPALPPGVPLHAAGSVAETLPRLLADSAADDLVVVFGSFFTVGAAMALLDEGSGGGSR